MVKPFLHPQFPRWIVALADSGIAPKLRLKYLQTVLGGQKADYDASMQFKKITICPSIDSIISY